MRLHEDNALLRVQSGGQPIERQVVDVALDFVRILECRQGMNVNDAINGIVFLLQLPANIIINCAQ